MSTETNKSSSECSEDMKQEAAEPESRLTEISRECYSELAAAVRTASGLPVGTARDLYCTYTSFHSTVEHLSEQTLFLANALMRSQGLRYSFKRDTVDTDILSAANDAVLDRVHIHSQIGRQAQAHNHL